MDFDTLFNHLDDTVLAQIEEQFRLSDQSVTRLSNDPSSATTDCAAQLAEAGDFERLVRFAEPLVAKYDDISSAEWEASPIGWIRQVSSSLKRGMIGEHLVGAWARSEGLHVEHPRHRGHDCVVAGITLEVKTSLRWNNDRFVFLQLREFDYDAIALLGLEPNDCRLWILPKEILWQNANVQLRGVSHEGSKWVSFFPDKPPAWLQGWGGSFAEAHEALHRVARHSIKRGRDIAENESWLELSSAIPWSWQDSGTAGAARADCISAPSNTEPLDLPDTPALLTSTAGAGAAKADQSPSLTHPPEGAIHVSNQHQSCDPHGKPDS
jgi:hypothetical protein